MKIIFKKAFVFTFTMAMLVSLTVFSQKKETGKTVPLDPEVRYGKLENGLTYYIKKNQKTENRAEFYLVNDVGAILETDAQNGLAHFCEHMCFNGTKSFPDKGILNYFETIGMQFGRNVNAGTGVERTTYMLMQTPVTREGIIDTALLALKDMSHYVLFTDEEIDNERGVIREELRGGKDANERMNDAIMPVMFKGSKFANRNVIGTFDVINNHPYDTLRQFYKDWYRTDLQAIIVVGDINVDQIESKIKSYYSTIPVTKNPKKRPVFDVPDNKEPIVAIATDKEAQNTSIDVYFKHNYIKPADKDMNYFMESFKSSLFRNMLNERLNELIQNENPPFIFASNYYGNFSGNKDAYTLTVFANNNIEYGLKTILLENERVRQHGFTQGELERAKTSYLRNLEKRFKEKDQQQNNRLAFQLSSHFLSNNPTPSIEFEYKLAQKVLPQIKLEEVNLLTKKWIRDDNVVITITAPEKEEIKIPTEAEVLAIFNESKQAKLEAYVDKVSDKPLMAKVPASGKIVNEKTDDALKITSLTLSNGVKVVIKPTNFKEDEILVSAFSNGGSSLIATEDLPSAEFATTAVSRSGISEFSLIELQKMLTGKVVNISPFIDDLYEGFNGSCAPNDLETALQLINLHFTSPRFDEPATNAFLSRYKSFLENKSANPDAVFGDSISFITNNRNPRKEPLSTDRINKFNFEKAKKIYSDRFADASDFTFVFTGNIDLQKAKPLFETYLGSLPSIKRKETWKDNNVRFPKGKVETLIERKLEVAKNNIYVNVNGNFEYNLENRLLLQTIKHVLQIRYTERIREEEGGTYSPQVWSTDEEFPVQNFSINVYFNCDPKNSDKLKAIVYEELESIIKNGPSEENLGKAKENFLKNRENDLKENKFWSTSIVFNLQHNDNMLDQVKYESTVKSITTEKVKQAASKLLTQGNSIEIVMQPSK